MELFVAGSPSTEKSHPANPGLRAWRDTLANSLKGAESVTLPCVVRLDFLLPSSFFPGGTAQNQPGSDLDNLAAPVLDALAKSVLLAAGGDGAIWELVATKRPVRKDEQPGVRISVGPILSQAGGATTAGD